MDKRHPYCGHGYVPLKCGGVVTRIGTQQQLRQNVNEVDQPWKWTLPCSVWFISNKHRLLLSLSAQPDNM